MTNAMTKISKGHKVRKTKDRMKIYSGSYINYNNGNLVYNIILVTLFIVFTSSHIALKMQTYF